MQRFSRVSACRRMLNSHDAASRENSAANQAPRCSTFWPAKPGIGRAGLQQAQQAVECGESKASDWQPQSQVGATHGVGTLSLQSVRRATAASSCAGVTCAQRWLWNVALQGRERGAGSNCSTPTSAARSHFVRRVALHGPSRPNPSVNARPNGRPPGPRGALVYPAPRGPGALPSVPRYLER